MGPFEQRNAPPNTLFQDVRFRAPTKPEGPLIAGEPACHFLAVSIESQSSMASELNKAECSLNGAQRY